LAGEFSGFKLPFLEASTTIYRLWFKQFISDL